jgi:hypothetical protein
MTRTEAAALALFLAAAAAACAHAPTKEGPVMQVQEWKGARGGPEEAGTAVATDAASWNKLWRRMGQAPPDFDLSGAVAVAVYIGRRPTGGWHASLEAASRGDDLVVRWRVLKPTGFTTQAFAEPWLVRAFPRPKGRVILEAAAE